MITQPRTSTAHWRSMGARALFVSSLALILAAAAIQYVFGLPVAAIVSLPASMIAYCAVVWDALG